MELNSCLYETTIMHHRLQPKEHNFSYKFFSFYLDLDELNVLDKELRFFSRNHFNIYSFYDKDHIGSSGHEIKENVLLYLKEQGIDLKGGRVMLLTYLRTFGYVFNPVSFYYCFDAQDNPICVVPEIGNTFGELKLFLIRNNHLNDKKYKQTQDKFYYISPFTNLDDQLDFRLAIPNEHLNIKVDTSKSGDKVLLTTMMGRKKILTNGNVLKASLKFPFVTLKVIGLIHWHALRLWMKRIPFVEKTDNLHLQKDVRVKGKSDDRHKSSMHKTGGVSW